MWSTICHKCDLKIKLYNHFSTCSSCDHQYQIFICFLLAGGGTASPQEVPLISTRMLKCLNLWLDWSFSLEQLSSAGAPLRCAPVGSSPACCFCTPASAAGVWTKSGSDLVLMATTAFLCWERSVCFQSCAAVLCTLMFYVFLCTKMWNHSEYLHKITH